MQGGAGQELAERALWLRCCLAGISLHGRSGAAALRNPARCRPGTQKGAAPAPSEVQPPQLLLRAAPSPGQPRPKGLAPGRAALGLSTWVLTGKAPSAERGAEEKARTRVASQRCRQTGVYLFFPSSAGLLRKKKIGCSTKSHLFQLQMRTLMYKANGELPPN